MASIIYHVMSRGVDKRTIFQEDKICLRFINDLYKFNDGNPAYNNNRSSSTFMIDVKHQSLIERDRLVELYAFCLMSNHYHLCLLKDDGVPRFMQKLNGGYVKYFNIKYGRKGRLFESTYKPVIIKMNRISFISRIISIATRWIWKCRNGEKDHSPILKPHGNSLKIVGQAISIILERKIFPPSPIEVFSCHFSAGYKNMLNLLRHGSMI